MKQFDNNRIVGSYDSAKVLVEFLKSISNERKRYFNFEYVDGLNSVKII